jgi:hypothetical protein
MKCQAWTEINVFIASGGKFKQATRFGYSFYEFVMETPLLITDKI